MDQSLKHLGLSFTSNYTEEPGDKVILQSGVQLTRQPMINTVDMKLLGDNNIDDEKIKDVLNFIVHEKLYIYSRVGIGPLIIDFLQRNALSGVTMVPRGIISHHNIREYEYHGFVPFWVPEIIEMEVEWDEITKHTFNGQVIYFNYFLWSRNQPLPPQFFKRKIDQKEKWGKIRDSIKSKRFKWQDLCSVFDNKSTEELRDIARRELTQHLDILSKRELCKILAQRLETKIELKQRARRPPIVEIEMDDIVDDFSLFFLDDTKKRNRDDMEESDSEQDESESERKRRK
jgi:hypothetical protein